MDVADECEEFRSDAAMAGGFGYSLAGEDLKERLMGSDSPWNQSAIFPLVFEGRLLSDSSSAIEGRRGRRDLVGDD